MNQPRTILFVDNDPVVRQLLSQFLAGEGYIVLAAASGTEALTIAQQHPDPIDLVVADVVMPRMDGFTLVARLTQDRPDMKVLYISGHYLDSLDVRRGLKESGRPFMLKPLRFQEFGQKVREVLEVVDPGAEVFATVVGNPQVVAQPMLDVTPPAAVSRATRYRARLPIRYRWRADGPWYTGSIQNISRSGLLFRLDEADPNVETLGVLTPGTPIHLLLELPPPKREVSPRAITCEGAFVRVMPSGKPWQPPSVAAAIRRYQVQP
jgi:CheY-like chemotaxis protein